MARNDLIPPASTPYNCTVLSGTPSRVISLSERPITVTLLSARFTPHPFALRDPILFLFVFSDILEQKNQLSPSRHRWYKFGWPVRSGNGEWTRKPLVSENWNRSNNGFVRFSRWRADGERHCGGDSCFRRCFQHGHLITEIYRVFF